MANEKITQLPVYTTPQPTDVLAIVDIGGNATSQIAVQDLVNGDVLVIPTGTTNDVSTSSHGFAPQGNGNIDQFLNGVGNYAYATSPTVARAYLSAAPQSIPSTTPTKILVDAESFDSNSDFDLPNSKFICSIAGFYQVHAGVYYGSTVDTVNYATLVFVNGVERISTSAISGGGANDMHLIGSDIISLGTGDYVELYAFQNDVAAINASNTTPRDTFISIARI